MKSLLFIIVLSISNSVFAHGKVDSHCDFQFKNYCAKLEFLKKPSRSYSSDFKLKFYSNKSKKLVMPKELVSTYLWMKMKNGHEHGSEEVVIEKKKDHYMIKNVWFVMMGSWQLIVELNKGKKNSEKIIKNIVIGR